MPMRSQAQRAAMHAAAAGKSTLGIPKKVGKEFVAADKGGKLPVRAGKGEEKGEKKPDRERGESAHFPPLSRLAKR